MEAYEGLRRQAVQLDGAIQHLEGRGILLRRGLAAWAQLRPSTVLTRLPESPSRPASGSPVPMALGAELVRLVAGLILGTRQERFLHA